MSQASQDAYRDHMTECLIKTGMDPGQARREAARQYPPPARAGRGEVPARDRDDARKGRSR